MRDISKNIEASNAWLKANRKKHKPVSLERVINRMGKGGLLSIEADAKTVKGSKQGFMTGILYLAPHTITGFNLCPLAKTCMKDCLFNSGRGGFTSSVTEARIIKTLWFLFDPASFKQRLIKDIRNLIAKANKQGLTPVVRLNGTSDLTIELVFKEVLEQFPEVQFYDYTKSAFRFKRKLPANYDLTFSYDGVNGAAAREVLANGGRVAAVFADHLPDTWQGFKVIDGDESDLRFLDDGGVVVGLKYKRMTDGQGQLHDDRFIITEHLNLSKVS